MKLPRDLSGASLSVRATGSHVRITVSIPRQGHLTVPLTKAIAAGTLAALVKDAAIQLETTVEDILSRIR